MAKIKLNPVLTSVSGAIGNLVFYGRWKQQYARVYVKPVNPDTEAQRANRDLFAEAMKSWQALPEDVKDRYRARARRLPMYGHNLYISEYMKSGSAGTNSFTAARLKQLRTAGRLYTPYFQQASLSVTTPYMIKEHLYLAKYKPENRYG